MIKSIHYFIHNFDDQDRLIVKLKEIFKDTQWFYIRYWEGGPHLRIRFLDDGNIYEKILLDTISKHPIENKKIYSKKEYYEMITVRESYEDQDNLLWYTPYSIEYIEYVPELERYGGTIGMPISERIFNISSNLASDIISKRSNLHQRLLLSLYFSYSILKTLDVNVNDFMGQYYSFWKTYENGMNFKVNEKSIEQLKFAIKSLDSKKCYMEEINKVVTELKIIKHLLNNKDYMLYILSSQIHMHNNRLGITADMEASYAKILMSISR